jgi:hypothetical protein
MAERLSGPDEATVVVMTDADLADTVDLTGQAQVEMPARYSPKEHKAWKHVKAETLEQYTAWKSGWTFRKTRAELDGD